MIRSVMPSKKYRLTGDARVIIYLDGRVIVAGDGKRHQQFECCVDDAELFCY